MNLKMILLLTILSASASAQSEGAYVITKSVIAGGGGQTAGSAYTLDGTVGQPVAGTTSTGGTFELGGGFWGGGTAVVASTASVSGRVLTSDGRGLRNATVSVTDSQGVIRLTTTSSFGFFSFDNVITGQAYTFRVSSRFFRFQPRTLQVDSNLTLADFVGLE